MKIATKFQINNLFSISMIVLISVTLLLNTFWLRTTIQDNKTINQIASSVYELNVLTSNYLLRKSEQTKLQWHLKSDSLEKLLMIERSDKPEEMRLIREIQQNHKSLKDIFDRLVVEYEINGQVTTEAYKNFEDLFVGQLLVKTQAMLSSAQQLSDIDQRAMLENQFTTSIVIISVIFGMTGMIILVSFLLKKDLITSIQTLQKGVKIIGDGNLDYQLKSKKQDEIGELSNAFDQMTGRLRELYRDLKNEIIEREQAEKVSRENEAKLQLITDNVPALIAFVDSNQQYRFINQKYGNFIKAAPSEVMGKSIKEVLGKKAYQAIRPKAEMVLTGQPVIHSTTFPGENGSFRYMEGTYVPHIHDGKIEGFFALIIDVTESQLREQKIQNLNQELQNNMEELKRSNNDLQQFAYVASHDLQAPLRTITSFIQIIEEDYHEKFDEEGKEILTRIISASTRMKILINDLLIYSRVGQKKQWEKTDLNEVVKDALENLAVPIREASIKISSESLPEVMGDSQELLQLYQNLIGNAVKFHGPVDPFVHIAVEAKNDFWEFSVQDNGIGIDDEYAEKIFIIFQRLHGHNTYPGTGIGLAICKKIVENHKGSIWMDSQEGKGSTFYFTLPC